MLTAINLDGQFSCRNSEINNIAAHRMLASDFDIRAGLSERAPDDPFGVGHAATELSGAFCPLSHCHTHLTRFASLTTLSSPEERVS